MPCSSNPPPPAADQIDDGEDSDGNRNSARSAAVAAASAAAVQTPPNSFVDPSAFKEAFEKHYQEMQKKFPTAAADHAAAAEGGRPLQEALRTMRASIPGRGRQQQQQPTSKSASAVAATSTAEMTEAEFEKLFNEMRLGPPPIGDALGDESLLPMMETMMQSLLSKDLLYPAIRDLADRFPDWLAEKRADFSPEQFGKFNRQYELTKQASI